MQQSHGQTQHLVDVAGQAAAIFTQAHISALFSGLEYKNNKFSTLLFRGGVPGEIKRSRDLRGGRWSWTLTLVIICGCKLH